MTAAIATPERIEVAIRPAAGPDERRMCQAQWTRSLETKWKHRAHMPGDRPAIPPSMTQLHGTAEERSGVQIGKPGYDQHDVRHDPHVLSHSLWMESHHLLVDALLERSSHVVAVLPDLPTEPVGWAVFEGHVLHFVFVVPAARRSSVATQLVLHTECSAASHMTPAGRGLVRHLRGTA